MSEVELFNELGELRNTIVDMHDWWVKQNALIRVVSYPVFMAKLNATKTRKNDVEEELRELRQDPV